MPFDLGASNGVDVRSVGFGFWPIKTHDSDRVRSKGGGGIGHGLVGTRLSSVNRVLFENIFWEGYLKKFTCVVERVEDRCSIKENPMVQTYDPWGLGSGQSEHTTQIARAVWSTHGFHE